MINLGLHAKRPVFVEYLAAARASIAELQHGATIDSSVSLFASWPVSAICPSAVSGLSVAAESLMRQGAAMKTSAEHGSVANPWPLASSRLCFGILVNHHPVVGLDITYFTAHPLCGTFGGAWGVLGIPGTLKMGLTFDAFSPVSDNVGGIAEMSQLAERVTVPTEHLTQQETPLAVSGDAFAIRSAALVILQSLLYPCRHHAAVSEDHC